jgi:hypothetical protein
MKISKEDAALAQLFDAVNLFFRKRCFSAITLGAAAEEIIGQLMKIRTEDGKSPNPSAIEIEVGMFEMFEGILETDYYPAYRNKIKNELKHHGEEINREILKGNFQQIAQMHISGALINYYMMHYKLPKDPIFKEYCSHVGLSLNQQTQ